MPEPERDPAEEASKALEQLKVSSQELKAKIEQERKRHDLPLDSTLGDPNWDEKAKDGHLDLPPDDDD